MEIRSVKYLFALLAILLCSIQGKSQVNADDIIGIWWNPEKNSRTQVFKKNGKYFGRIIWLEDNFNPDGSQPRRDYLNVNPSLRERPLLGAIVMEGLTWDKEDQEWQSGKIYDPRRGRSYSLYTKMKSSNAMSLNVYLFGMSFFSKELLCQRFDSSTER